MPNPLAAISPLLDLLGKEVKILPAAGGAVEELQQPDQEEIENIVINKDAENSKPSFSNFYRWEFTNLFSTELKDIKLPLEELR